MIQSRSSDRDDTTDRDGTPDPEDHDATHDPDDSLPGSFDPETSSKLVSDRVGCANISGH